MEMNEKIYMLRKRHNMTLEEVGNAVGVSKSTVRKWESGEIANMRRDKIATLARALHTTPAYLMGWTDEQEQNPDLPAASNIIPMPNMRKIPLIGTIACGEPILAEENIECEVDIPDNIRADFALRCKGPSMINAGIHDGDIVYIRRQDEVENGQIAAVIIDQTCDEATATLKRVYYNRAIGEVRLVPENNDEPTRVYYGEELNSIRILGLAVGLTRSLENK